MGCIVVAVIALGRLCCTAVAGAGEPPGQAPHPKPPLVPTPTLVASSSGTSEKTLNFNTIVRWVFERNPSVRASRAEMRAARHGLTEFRANLSRLEPFSELRSDLADYPNRRGAFGNTVESVVGVKKETFEGSVISAEVGGSFSRFTFDEALNSGTSRETGGGALVRTRVEVPFLGSRKRQDRVISQAFQESTARRAQLDYLKNYRTIVESALSYYNLVVYYRRLVAAYREWEQDLDTLLKDPRIQADDRRRIESVRASAMSTHLQYSAREHEYLTSLLSYLALESDDGLTLDMPDYALSPYADQSRRADGLQELVDRARLNNPAFRVLNDAIANVELQREQAVRGKLDVTTFLEGTLHPLGSASFDDRFDGWAVGGGVNIRLNDHRVRDATRLKAEAQIEQFKAEIEAEEINSRRKILSTTKALIDNDSNQRQMLDVARRKREEYTSRLVEFFKSEINVDQLMGTRSELASNGANLANNQYYTADREATLLLAIGQIYEIVGLRIGEEAR